MKRTLIDAVTETINGLRSRAQQGDDLLIAASINFREKLMAETLQSGDAMKRWQMWAVMALYAIGMVSMARAQGGVPSVACSTPATAQAATAGYVPILRNSGDQTFLLCSVTAQVTQGDTPANYQLLGCRDNSCTDSYAITPPLPGHADQYDSYNLPPNPSAQIVLRKGYGLYLYLSGTAQAVVQAIYGAY